MIFFFHNSAQRIYNIEAPVENGSVEAEKSLGVSHIPGSPTKYLVNVVMDIQFDI